MEYLITNGKIYTLDEEKPEAGAVLVKNGKVAEVFDSAFRTSGVVDLEGRTLLPGFIDSHVHLLHTGLSLMEISLEGAESLEEVFDRLRRGVAPRRHAPTGRKSRQGATMPLRAVQLAPENLRERRYPTRRELDRISERIPIFVRRRDGHSLAVNTKGLESLSIPEGIEGLDRENGILKREANGWAWRKITGVLSREERREAFKRGCDLAIQKGITTLNALDGDKDPERDDIELLLELEDHLSCDLVPFFQTLDVLRVKRLGLPRIGGCVSLDGSIGSHSAALFEPYLDDSGNRGCLYFKDEELEDFVGKSVERGLQVTVHAIGDRAVDQILRAYEVHFKNQKSIFKNNIKELRCRIEHAEILTGDQIGRIAEMGIVLSMQPSFEAYWGGPGKMYEERLGKERAEGMNPFRKLLDGGVRICGGSDSPITPLDPLLGIHSAVNHPFHESRVNIKEAVEMFTTSGAWACFREDKIGKISRGYQADFVVLSKDLFTISPEKLREVEILKVVRKGEIVFEKRCSGRDA